MILSHADFLINTNTNNVAICAIKHGLDTVHVGVCWVLDDEKKIIHFQNGHYIPLQDIENGSFANYYFKSLNTFPVKLIPTLAAMAELISLNKINGFRFNRDGVVYNGGKFDFTSGNYNTLSVAEKFVNCAVFVIGLLKSFDLDILNWDTWPNPTAANLVYLDEWLNENNIPAIGRDQYYNQTKEVRGRHVFAATCLPTMPGNYIDVEPKSQEILLLMV